MWVSIRCERIPKEDKQNISGKCEKTNPAFVINKEEGERKERRGMAMVFSVKDLFRVKVVIPAISGDFTAEELLDFNELMNRPGDKYGFLEKNPQKFEANCLKILQDVLVMNGRGQHQTQYWKRKCADIKAISMLSFPQLQNIITTFAIPIRRFLNAQNIVAICFLIQGQAELITPAEEPERKEHPVTTPKRKRKNFDSSFSPSPIITAGPIRIRTRKRTTMEPKNEKAKEDPNSLHSLAEAISSLDQI